ncbi:MAG TPA: lanthionine synthetase LanC family protein [Kofleriaceae bacterium]|nr:lanthionine synthetase LanC family protein [Kofleriaceae bacterium]
MTPPGDRAGATWRPLLEGEEAEAARAARDAVVAELARLQPDPIGLDGGWAGLALVHGALARGGDEEALDRCADCLERAFDQLGEVRSPWLVDGVAGVAWVAGHLADLIDIEEDTLAELDGLCARLLARDRWTGAWEHLYGLVGLALPAVDGRSPAAERARADALRHLAAGAERPGDGLTWRAPPEMLASGDERAANPGGYHDLGMAHGACGIAALLARAGGEASELLEGAVRWLRARDGGDPAGRFPLRLGASLASRRQLDGWCYGDQAAGAALVAAGGAAGRADWIAHGVEVARAAAARQPRLADATLCHGALGRAHLFSRIGQATGAEDLLDAARAWYRRALAMRRPGEGVGGFALAEPGASPAGLLTGGAGLALALDAAVSAEEPRWDRALLVDLAPGALTAAEAAR